MLLQPAQDWSQETFGNVKLGDNRLRQRALEMERLLAYRPSDSLPQQMSSWSQQKAAYRSLDNAKVSHEALSKPHGYHTLKQ